MTETQECYAVIDAMNAIIRPMNDAIASQDWSEVIRHASELESYASSVVVWAEDLPTDLRPRMRSVALACREKALTTRRQASALLESYASSVVVWAEDLPTDLRPRMRSVALACREKALTTRRQASALLECDVDEPTPLLVRVVAVWCLLAGLVLPIIILWWLYR